MAGQNHVDPSKNASAPLGGGARISLAQRGRAGMQFLGALQHYTGGELRSIARAQFEADADGQAIMARKDQPDPRSWPERIAERRAVNSPSEHSTATSAIVTLVFENVFLVRGEEGAITPKILDFGLSKSSIRFGGPRDSDRITFTRHAEMRRRGKRNSLRNAGILNAGEAKTSERWYITDDRPASFVMIGA